MICTEAELKIFLGLSSAITAEEQAVLTLVHPQAESSVKHYLGYDPEQKVRTEFYPKHQHAGGLAIRNWEGGRWDVNPEHSVATYQPYTHNVNRTLQLQHIPLRSVSEVYADYDGRHGEHTGFSAGTLLTYGSQYWAEMDQQNLSLSGCLIRDGGWPLVPGSIKVVYRGGYSPEELAGRATTSGTDSSGIITVADVDASGIKRAVVLTVLKAFKTWATMKKTATGFVAGPLQSERLGDYSYSLAGNAGESIAGLITFLPPEAMEALEQYRHYGLMRL